MNENAFEPIPLEMALELCAAIRRDFDEVNWQSPAARWCWACQEKTGGDPEKRGYLRAEGNRGCLLVNSRFTVLQAQH